MAEEDEDAPVGAADVLVAAAASEPSTTSQAFGAALVDRLRDLVDERREVVRTETFGPPRDPAQEELPLDDSDAPRAEDDEGEEDDVSAVYDPEVDD